MHEVQIHVGWILLEYFQAEQIPVDCIELDELWTELEELFVD